MARTVRLAAAGDLRPGQGKTVDVEGLEVAVFRLGEGRYCALGGSCPHEGGPLGQGAFYGGRILCPWHGFDFDPATGACGADPDLSVPVYPTRVEDGQVVADLPDPPGSRQG